LDNNNIIPIKRPKLVAADGKPVGEGPQPEQTKEYSQYLLQMTEAEHIIADGFLIVNPVFVAIAQGDGTDIQALVPYEQLRYVQKLDEDVVDVEPDLFEDIEDVEE
jgi:hypothetical protein